MPCWRDRRGVSMRGRRVTLPFSTSTRQLPSATISPPSLNSLPKPSTITTLPGLAGGAPPQRGGRHVDDSRRQQGRLGGTGAPRRAARRGGQPRELLLQLLQREEVAVVRREAHVGDVAQLSQALHDEVADLGRRHLAAGSGAGVEGRLDVFDDGVDLGRAYRELGAGAADAGAHLLARELLAAAVLLGDGEDGLDALVGGEASAAVQALAAAADAVVGLAGVGDLGVGVAAVGAP